MSFVIISISLYVKIKHVAKTCKQLKKIWKNLLKKRVWKIKKKVVDKIQTKWYTKWVAWVWQQKTKSYNESCERKWSLKIEQNI